MGASFIESHGQNLLRYVGMGILQITRLEDGRPAPGDFPLGAYAQRRAVEQRGRIARIGEYGANHLAGKFGSGNFIAGVLVHRFAEQFPEREPFKLVKTGPDDLQSLLMRLGIAQKAAKCIAQEEAHREAAGVGREAENVKIHPGVEPRHSRLTMPRSSLSS